MNRDGNIPRTAKILFYVPLDIYQNKFKKTNHTQQTQTKSPNPHILIPSMMQFQ